jgi:uncharacterized protein (TIGR02453 family)
MAARFSGFPPEAITFLRELKENNHRDWFQPRKEIFETRVKAPMLQLVEALNAEFASLAPECVTEPSKAIYRIYRDTRFSSDKTPYKTHIAANFHPSTGEKHSVAGYYCSVGAEQIEWAAGVYMPGPEALLQLRQAISQHFDEFRSVALDKRVTKFTGELQGEALSRPPKGFAPEDPAVEWIKRKQWYYYTTNISPDLACTPKLLAELWKRCKAAAPFVAFCNRCLRPRKTEVFT